MQSHMFLRQFAPLVISFISHYEIVHASAALLRGKWETHLCRFRHLQPSLSRHSNESNLFHLDVIASICLLPTPKYFYAIVKETKGIRLSLGNQSQTFQMKYHSIVGFKNIAFVALMMQQRFCLDVNKIFKATCVTIVTFVYQ